MSASWVRAGRVPLTMMLGLAMLLGAGIPNAPATKAEPLGRQVVEFDAPGEATYVIPVGARDVRVEVWGGDAGQSGRSVCDDPDGSWAALYDGGQESALWGDVAGMVSLSVGAGGRGVSTDEAVGSWSAATVAAVTNGGPSRASLPGVGSVIARGGLGNPITSIAVTATVGSSAPAELRALGRDAPGSPPTGAADSQASGCTRGMDGAPGRVRISYERFTPVSLAPLASVEIVGRGATAVDEFTFSMRPIGTVTEAAVAGGAVVIGGSSASVAGPFPEYVWAPVPFGGIEFLRPGVFNFAVTQTNTGSLQPGVSAVTHTTTFAVTVTADDAGRLTATPSYGRDGLRFTEKYAETRASVELAGAMVVQGADARMTLPVAGAFTYRIDAVTTGAPLPMTTTVNDAAGQVAFGAVGFGPADLEGASEIGNGLVAKTYVYRVTQSGGVAGVASDTASSREFTVRVVRDIATGKITAATSSAPLFAFLNKYTPGTAVFAVPKVAVSVVGLPPASRRTVGVMLSADDPATRAAVARGEVTGSSQVAQVSAGSSAATLDLGDIGFSRPGSYSFRLAEEPPPDVVASTGACVFAVAVADDGTGQLTASLTHTSPADGCFALRNTYVPRVAQLALRGVASVNTDPAGAGLMLGVGDIAPGYSYTVTGVGGAPLPSGCGSPCTVAMDAAGNVDLGVVGFGRDLLGGAASADFTYRVVQAGSHRGVTNDPTPSRQFTVQLSEDSEGRLVAALQPPADGTAFAFTSTYSVQPATTPAIDASLLVNGADATGQRFDFEIVARGADTQAAVASGDLTLPGAEEVVGGTDGTSVSFAFNGITFARPGRFSFTARQLSASLPAGIGPQVEFVDFSATVTDNLDGTLRALLSVPAGGLAFVDVSPPGAPPTATPTPPPAPPLPAPTSVTVPATLTLVGRDGLAGEQAVLGIRAVNGAATAGVSTGSILLPSAATVALGANGEPVAVTLGDIEFTQPGRFQFTACRTDGSATGVSGLTGAVAFTVDVIDNGDGTMTAALLAPAGGLALMDSYATTAQRFRFAGLMTVAHDPEDGSLGVTAAELAGRYAFTLSAPAGTPLPNGCTTTCEATSDSNGVVDFGTIPYTIADLAGRPSATFAYTVAETGSAPGVVDDPVSERTIAVALTDNEDGTLSVDVAAGGGPVFSFAATYTPQPATVGLTAAWMVRGRHMAPGETAAFDVISADPSDTGMTLPAMSTVAAGLDGQPSTFPLGEATFSRPGLYELVARVVNDDPTWDVTAVRPEVAFAVEVADTGDGTLQATTRLPDGGLAFVGETAETAATQLEVTGLALLDLASPTLVMSFADLAGQFEFTLTALDPDTPLTPSAMSRRDATGSAKGAPPGTAALTAPTPSSATATSDATGTVRFGSLTFTSADLAGATSRTFRYQVTQAGWTAGVDNDPEGTTGLTFAVTVAIDGDGRLSHTTSPAGDLFESTNTYSVEPVDAVIQTEKTLNGRLLQAEEFEFALTGGDGAYQRVRHDAQGVANFAPIPLAVPGSYSSLLEELHGDDPDILYDERSTVVTLTAVDDGAGHLDVTADPSGLVTFANHCVTMGSASFACEDGTHDEYLALTGVAVYALMIVSGLLIAGGLWLIRRRTTAED